MSRLRARGAAWLRGKVEAFGGVAVTYTAAGESRPLTATPAGRRSADGQGVTGPARVEAGERDYLVDAAAFAAALAGVVTEPAAGHRVAETVDGVACVFELAPRRDEPAWRWADSGRTQLRLFTRQVA